MNDRPKPKRPYGVRAFVLVMAGALLLGAIAGAGGALLEDQGGLLGLVLTATLMVAVTIGSLAMCLWWWRGIDEAAREAHKWAWWWGGCSGMAVGAAVLLTLTLRDDGSTVESVGVSAPDLVAGGMFAILLFQIAGYAIAWAGWWLKHR